MALSKTLSDKIDTLLTTAKEAGLNLDECVISVAPRKELRQKFEEPPRQVKGDSCTHDSDGKDAVHCDLDPKS
jgi:hypothetical protein